MIKICDVVTINCPLHPETENLFNEAMIGKMKRGAYLVNTARGKICDRDAVVRALKSRATCWLRGRRLVSAATNERSPLAYHAPPRDDAAHIGDIIISPGPLRCWNQGNPGM